MKKELIKRINDFIEQHYKEERYFGISITIEDKEETHKLNFRIDKLKLNQPTI